MKKHGESRLSNSSGLTENRQSCGTSLTRVMVMGLLQGTSKSCSNAAKDACEWEQGQRWSAMFEFVQVLQEGCISNGEAYYRLIMIVLDDVQYDSRYWGNELLLDRTDSCSEYCHARWCIRYFTTQIRTVSKPGCHHFGTPFWNGQNMQRLNFYGTAKLNSSSSSELPYSLSFVKFICIFPYRRSVTSYIHLTVGVVLSHVIAQTAVTLMTSEVQRGMEGARGRVTWNGAWIA